MPSQVSALHQKGQKLYQKGDFRAAIEIFGEALNEKDADAIGILDNRAATHCKLEQYDQARRDARHMIKKAQGDERGYLRCAKVLLLEGKPEKALEIYAYGLKTLPSEHPRRGMLEQLHQKLEERMLVNRQDPFTMLPLEMAAMVIEHFSFKQIVGILRVCKTWERFFGSMPHLWMKIDLTGARGKVPWTAVRSYIRRSKAMLTHAIIKNLATASTPKTLEFLSRCPRLEQLELWVDCDYKEIYNKFKGCKHLKSLTLSPNIPIPHEYFGRLLVELPQLERIALWNVRCSSIDYLASDEWPRSLPNMKSITLASRHPSSLAFPVDGFTVPGLLPVHQPDRPMYPNLEELRLDWDPPRYQLVELPAVEDHWPPLRRLDLRGFSLEPDFCANFPTSLEYICVQGGKMPRRPINGPREPLPNLNTVIFNDSEWVTVQTLMIFLVQSPAPIRTIVIDQCPNVSASVLLVVLQARSRFPQSAALTELSISHLRDLDDAFVTELYTWLPQLKILNLSYTRITGCTIRMLADRRVSGDLHKLDRLFVRGCEDLSSDAVAYGREKGLEVVT